LLWGVRMNDLTIDPEMRRRLSENREGSLTSDQWLSLSLAPLTALMFVLVPAVLMLTMRFRMVGFAVAMVGGLGLLLVFGTQRLAQYARLPVCYEVMTAVTDLTSAGRGTFDFVDERDEVVRFVRHLTPGLTTRKGLPYHVYYVTDGRTRVLLSLAPYTEGETRTWEPTAVFKARYERRVQEKPKGKPKRG